ncbi:1-deoxy-D-xylulose-5-phosphate reductoisomerase [Aciditerrimonas ferrireducens]|uniref:1-deoxy-D-xylulose-5-phosphate reductoisomerase n=1 Tax=Aciditerrimonas ferrireducens TaxID=667306 RepID=UPI002003C23E|nr:1-deoxy-D-xylulose-5-phosphate reductoisomerase [Aciditerrimonas ferrireducens]MCK4177738.1 1-deoxy-D-xylulose-5-phosphate reductoisomerase [Aciditerrimonas ferrireducens]
MSVDGLPRGACPDDAPADEPSGPAVTVALLGSTGSIGTQAVEVVRAVPGRFEVVALAAGGRDPALLLEQARTLRPSLVVVGDPAAASAVGAGLPKGCELAVGPEGLAAAAERADVVLNAVVGFAGLPATLAALRAGRRLALANKQSLVAGGPVVQQVWDGSGAEVVPVDSEHCALHQCLRAGRPAEVAKLVLTASGGPFRGRSAAELADVGPADALAHPTWQMGPQNTVDSSTLMNKGLEVIEAHQLFGVPYDHIEVVVHPQSVIHSMVEFCDGSTMAQLSRPDMRLPIGYALGYPARLPRPFGPIDWRDLRRLDFELPDRQVFRCLALAEQAGRAGGVAPAWLVAANEVAVAAFLAGRLPWLGIAEVVESCLERCEPGNPQSVEEIVEADRQARGEAERVVAARERAA